MKNSLQKYLCLAVVLLIAGCASAPEWWRVSGPYERDTYAVELPQGWMMPSRTRDLLLTRDGIYLQNISISRSNVAAPLNHTKRKFAAGMLPQEAAEIFLDDGAANEDITNFEVLENKPARIGGVSAFRAVYTWKDKDKLKYKGITYGFEREKTFYDVSYAAPVRYYFSKDEKTFEAFARSFRLIAPEREVELPPQERKEEKSILQGANDN